MGRRAPWISQPTSGTGSTLSPRFEEWHMGLPEGWVTDPRIGLSMTAQKECLGNGVVPQQCEAALRYLLDVAARYPSVVA